MCFFFEEDRPRGEALFSFKKRRNYMGLSNFMSGSDKNVHFALKHGQNCTNLLGLDVERYHVCI